jgi:hypothetical protein
MDISFATEVVNLVNATQPLRETLISAAAQIDWPTAIEIGRWSLPLIPAGITARFSYEKAITDNKYYKETAPMRTDMQTNPLGEAILGAVLAYFGGAIVTNLDRFYAAFTNILPA